MIVTSLMVGAHPPLADVIVHLSTVVPPIVSPVTADAGSLTEEAVPVPDSVVHVPVSLGLGVLAAMIVVVTLHRSWSGPPAAAVVAESTVMVTSEVVTAHPPLWVVMVQRNTDVSPTESPVTPDVGSLISVTIAEPERTAHPPESVPDGVFAARVVVMMLQRSWSGPAAATVPEESTLIVTSLNVAGHPPNWEVMVQRSTVEKPIVSPVTPDVGLLTLEADPDPDIVDHVPVSLILVELAARVVMVTPHRFCSVPASAIVVVESEVIVTSLVVSVHPPLADVIVHLSTVVSPMVSPVTADVSLFTLDADPVPETVVHVPVSEAAAALAANVPEVVLQRFCVDPAAATVIAGSTVIVTSLVVGAQPPNPDVIVHLSMVVSPIVSPVTADVSLLTLDAVPVPENVVHVPVSDAAGALAANTEDVVLQRF